MWIREGAIKMEKAKGGSAEIRILKRRTVVAALFILFGIATIFFNPWAG